MALDVVYEDRGFGRAYVVIEAPGAPRGSLSARATAPGGPSVPVSVVAAPKGGTFILIAPLMAFDYDVGIVRVDAEGLETTTYRILAAGRPEQAPPPSQLLLSGLDDIRNVDLNPTPDAVWIRPDKSVYLDDDLNVIHADVVAPFPEGVDPGEPRLTLLRLDGMRFELSAPIVLEHEVEAGGGGLAVHRLQLSFRIPDKLPCFVAWVHWGALEGFTVAEPWLLGKLRGEWWSITHRDSNKGDYHGWFLGNGRADDRTLRVQSRTTLEGGPSFSIVVPVFHTPLDYLADMVDSVRAQTYPRWELLLVNASPEDGDLGVALHEYAASDGRIRVLSLEGNRGIALNTRVGIDAAGGDYVCFLDHDDFLEPNALFEYASAVLEDPAVDLLYCDEDLFIDGVFAQGYFKPDFNLRMLLNHNYVTHLLCVSRRALDALRDGPGLPDASFDGAQDYALTLLVAALGRPIHHVRKFLYHWRAHSGSTSVSQDAKRWTDDAGRRALEAYLEEAAVAASVEPGVEQNIYDVVYDVPREWRVSAVVVRTRDDDRYRSCVASVLGGGGHPLHEVVVVNPYGPLDPSVVDGERVREVRVGADASPAQRRDAGADVATGKYLLFLDDRCLATESGWLERLLGPLAHPDVAVTGAGLFYPDGLTRHVGICIPEGQPRFVSHHVPAYSEDFDYYRRVSWFTRDVTAVSGSAMLVSAERFHEVAGFDGAYEYGLDDVDLCLRLREEGFATVVVPRAALTYRGFAPNGRVLPFSYYGQPASPRSLADCVAVKHDEGLFRTRWSRFWGFGDPLYNPQLAKESCHYQISRW